MGGFLRGILAVGRCSPLIYELLKIPRLIFSSGTTGACPTLFYDPDINESFERAEF